MVANKYRVLKSLGQGAMGEVFLVLPPRGEPVALKLLRTLDEKAGQNAVEQFENEFKVLKRLSHPNIARIFDYGYDEAQKKVFFTMPWLKGTDIFIYTKDLPFEECEELFVQMLRALNYLHQKNLMHCDLKPGNIHVEEGHVQLIDFGLTGYFGDFIVGTPTYLAPEIYQGGRHTVASDLYALGVIIYNCLTRTQPFSGKNLQEIYDRHRTLTPPPIHELNKKVPKYFSDIVATLINKKPEERFPSAAAIIEEIDAFSKKKYAIETEQTLLSYLPTQSEMVGRKEILFDIQNALTHFLSPESQKPYHVIYIHGKKNTGKSALVSKISNDLQLAKISVERALPPFQDNDRHILKSAKAIIFENLESYQRAEEERHNLTELSTMVEQKILSPETTRFLFIVTSTQESDFDFLKRLFPNEATAATSLELLPYTKEETREFLSSIIGQKEIPQTFLDQFHTNTEGLPELATEVIQIMIAKGLLFDPSGRWNEDLLSDLVKIFDKLEVSESLEQEFERTYATLSAAEENIVNWLSLCPHGLTEDQIKKLITTSADVSGTLQAMVDKRILRHESDTYLLYRKIFQNFVQENLPTKECKRRHTQLAQERVGLEPRWALYHLSLSHQGEISLVAAEKLAALLEKLGQRDNAVDIYHNLLKENPTAPLPRKVSWSISASTLLIWLDRFQDALALLEKIEKELHQDQIQIDFESFLLFLEKKGLALLHLQELDTACAHFKKGLEVAKHNPHHLVHQLRFENDLAEVELIRGRHEEAIAIFQRTREAARTLDPAKRNMLTNNDLGHVYLQQQEFDASLNILAEDMRFFSTIRNEEPLARALYSYAQVLQAKSDSAKAIRAYEECVRICKRGHFLPLLLRAYNGLGNLHAATHNNEGALRNYQKAIELSVRLKDITSKSALLFNQGFIYHGGKNQALATRRFLLAIQVLENKEKKMAYDNLLLTRCYNALAVISSEEHNTMKALSYLLERVKITDELQMDAFEKFNVKYDLAETYLKIRLKEQFLHEFGDLRKLAIKKEQHDKLDLLEEEYKAIQSYGEQEDTGRIPLSEKP